MVVEPAVTCAEVTSMASALLPIGVDDAAHVNIVIRQVLNAT